MTKSFEGLDTSKEFVGNTLEKRGKNVAKNMAEALQKNVAGTLGRNDPGPFRSNLSID